VVNYNFPFGYHGSLMPTSLLSISPGFFDSRLTQHQTQDFGFINPVPATRGYIERIISQASELDFVVKNLQAGVQSLERSIRLSHLRDKASKEDVGRKAWPSPSKNTILVIDPDICAEPAVDRMEYGLATDES
jgi:hypothetical protein